MIHKNTFQQNSFCNVAILAGGMGTRLRERSGDLPKPMVPILFKPVLQYQIELCQKFGFTEIALLVQHRHEKILEYFGDGSRFGVSIKYVIETEPRGTAGAIRDALHTLDDRFLVLYGDTFVDVDLSRIWRAHIKSGAAGTLLLHPNDHPQDSDLVQLDLDGNVQSIQTYPHSPGSDFHNLVNAALYVLDRIGLKDVVPAEGKYDAARHMFPAMLKMGKRLHGYITPEYIKDMGTPKRLDKVERDYINGLPEKLSYRHLRGAIFLDRDGTLIQEINHLTSPCQVELIPGVAEAVSRINSSGLLAVVVTNQPVVARGDITFEQLDKVHARFESQLGAGGAYVDKIYYCPHHPDKGFLGEVPELKRDCLCRKPEIGLIDLACKDLNIDRHKSWMIGDTTVDIEAGRRAGIRTVLVRTGYAGSDAKYIVRPDYIFPDLTEAIEWILEGRADMARRMIHIAMAASHDVRLVLIGGPARAGKTFAAQVLRELLDELGRTSHIISLDAWLKPKDQRLEDVGVCQRYDLLTATRVITDVVCSKTRQVLRESLYDRKTRSVSDHAIDHSIGPDDIVIVEGVPALLMEELNSQLNTIKVFVNASPTTRSERLAKDYGWRNPENDEYLSILAKREFDEIPIVIKSRDRANFIIEK